MRFSQIKLFVLCILSLLNIGVLCERPSVIVVGAGAAGIAAAVKLLEHKIDDIVILEAENRFGGRIYSVYFGNGFVDMGAEWCHGEKGNAVYELVKEYNILKSDRFENKMFLSSGKKIDDELVKELFDIMNDVYEQSRASEHADNKTVGDFCTEKFNEKIHQKFDKDSEKLKIASSSLDFFHHYTLGYDGTFSWFDIVAASDFRDCEGDFGFDWNGLGYKTALEVLMKKFPNPSKQIPIDQRILLNKQVTKIVWNETEVKNGVTVECSDKTIYKADHIIFTPSIGVLKHNYKTLFFPQLPVEKQTAIENIGFAAVIKVMMKFNEIWWDCPFTALNFIWDPADDEKLLKKFPDGPSKNGRSWLTQLSRVLHVDNNPKVLSAWFTGEMVPEIELISDKMMMNGLEYALKKFMGNHYNVSKPEVILRGAWFANPNFRGTYSFQTLRGKEHSISPQQELAKPLLTVKGHPIVQFAGEATHPYFYSTVHGAIETGRREAERIINSHKH